MAHYNIIARTNGVGLDRDVSLLKAALLAEGHQVTVSHRKEKSWLHRLCARLLRRRPAYDVNLFIERIFPAWIPFAQRNVLVPNQERFPHRHLSRLKEIDLVLAKSRHAEEIFTSHGCKTAYIGFTSEDVNLPEIQPDYRKFLHLAGKSTMKGTDTILSLWAQHPEWPMLTLIQHPSNAPDTVPDNVHLISEYLPQDELQRLLNEHGVHLCPSTSEGWGHYIVEAMSVGALVLTTDAPPMNELITPERGILVPYSHTEPRHLGTNYYVAPQALEQSISDLLAQPALAQHATAAPAWFHQNHAGFPARLHTALSS